MIKSLNTAATGMQAQQTNMDVIANNIANTSTNGFKKARAEFEDLLYQNVKEPGAATGLNSVAPTGVQIGLGVKTGAVQRDFTNGSIKTTNRDLDINILGSGFFQVARPDGTMAYTRNGEFHMAPDGRIVDMNGNALQPEITVPDDSVKVLVNASGEVSYQTQESAVPQAIGQIELATFVNPTGLKALGGNIFQATPASGDPNVGNPGVGVIGSVAQGEIETSNVNIVEEMVNMITTQRAYETNSKVIQASDQMLQALTHLR
ncbi:MAG: flagellar basal-body rod protein FlgG [Bdellovibrionaceae bacterium]|nr:flagellar basal-body rod protein FlgG [Pseudobdellovibrionaceae bacterium]